MLLRTENRMAMSLSFRQTFKIDLERTGRFYFSTLYYNMSALSLINQFPIIPLTVVAGAGADGAQDEVLSSIPSAGVYIGSVTITLAGAGVTSGDFVVAFDGTVVCTTILGAVGVEDTATGTFFFQSDGVSALTINVVGTGAGWTSGASTLFLRQIA